jgi:hypothetical protein
MKAIIAMVACVVLSITVVPAFANSKTIEVQKDKQGKAGEDISIKTTTIDANLISIDEEKSFTLQAADVKDETTKAAAIAKFINDNFKDVTAAANMAKVTITSKAGLKIIGAKVSPLKSGEKDKLVALGLDANPFAPVVLALTLGGTGNIGAFFASIEIEGPDAGLSPYTVNTGGKTFEQLLDEFKTQINDDPNALTADVFATSNCPAPTILCSELRIFNGTDSDSYSVFFGDEVPPSGFSYGFSEALVIPAPSTLALLSTGVLATVGYVWRRRARRVL